MTRPIVCAAGKATNNREKRKTTERQRQPLPTGGVWWGSAHVCVCAPAGQGNKQEKRRKKKRQNKESNERLSSLGFFSSLFSFVGSYSLSSFSSWACLFGCWGLFGSGLLFSSPCCFFLCHSSPQKCWCVTTIKTHVLSSTYVYINWVSLSCFSSFQKITTACQNSRAFSPLLSSPLPLSPFVAPFLFLSR